MTHFTLPTLQTITSTTEDAQNVENCVLARFNRSQYLPWDNPDNIASEQIEAYTIAVKDFTLLICLLIGGPANVINMVVFYKQGLRDRVNLCLFMLAVSDWLFLVSSFCHHAENLYFHVKGRMVRTPVNEFMANNNLIFFLGSASCSVTLSAIIACERCYCILQPLKYQNLLRTRTMALIIAMIYTSVFILFYLVSYRYWVSCIYDPVTGKVVLKMTGGGFYNENKTFIDFLDSTLIGVGFNGGTMFVVTTATVITTVKLRKVAMWRNETSSSSFSARELALTKMLVGNSIFFIVCISPGFFFRVAFYFLPEMAAGRKHHNFYYTTLWVLVGFCFINSSCNFFIYYTMGTRYREVFWALFGKKNCKGKC